MHKTLVYNHLFRFTMTIPRRIIITTVLLSAIALAAPTLFESSQSIPAEISITTNLKGNGENPRAAFLVGWISIG